jgi:Protein of unknown function (DUF4232)
MKRCSVMFCLFILSALCAAQPLAAQATKGDAAQSSAISDLTGNWSGESICVNKEKFPACHDEQVVYRIVKASGKSNTLNITMDKIVNGKPEFMAALDFVYDAQQQTLSGEFTRNNWRGVFEFAVKGDLMEGALTTLPDKTIVRRIKVKKDKGKQDSAHGESLAVALCLDSQLSVRHVSEDAAMGGVRTTTYAFANDSSVPCALKGYPRFEVLNKSGRTVRGGRAANGLTMMGDEFQKPPQAVMIEPGQTATFLVYYNAGGAGHTGKPCPTYHKVRINAPGNKRGFVLREDMQLCGRLEVSPVGLPSEDAQ